MSSDALGPDQGNHLLCEGRETLGSSSKPEVTLRPSSELQMSVPMEQRINGIPPCLPEPGTQGSWFRPATNGEAQHGTPASGQPVLHVPTTSTKRQAQPMPDAANAPFKRARKVKDETVEEPSSSVTPGPASDATQWTDQEYLALAFRSRAGFDFQWFAQTYNSFASASARRAPTGGRTRCSPLLSSTSAAGSRRACGGTWWRGASWTRPG